MSKTPNVVLILTDDQGYGDIACHGNSVLNTPNLDHMCSNSVRLTDFHVDPMCSPSRAALLTGRYSARTGVWSTLTGRYIMREDENTLAEVFNSSGYRTGMFGKWHLGDNYPYRPQDRGFHDVLTFGAGVVGEIPDYWNNNYFEAQYLRNGIYERFDKYCTDVWFDEAINFIKDSESAPFFCYISTNAPHGPFNIHSDYSTPYQDLGIPYDRARFYGMITNIDHNIGKLHRNLVELGIEDNTIVIFLGDNGTSAGASVDEEGFCIDGYNAGMRGVKCWAYDGGHRNSCFIRYPAGGLTSGREINSVTAHFDLMPTLISMCDLNYPDGVSFDGIDLSPQLMNGRPGDNERILFVHNQQLDHPKKHKDLEVIMGSWRLVITEQWGLGLRELFNVDIDPGQSCNLFEQYPEVTSKLLKEYDMWWNDISVRFDEYSDIVIGSGPEEHTKLTCHSWHGKKGLYSQVHVREGMQDNGYWAIRAERNGLYKFELRRGPIELQIPICEGVPAVTGIPFVDDVPAGVPLAITGASIQIGDYKQNTNVDTDDHSAVFYCNLQSGSNRLQTWFTDESEDEMGAYYVYGSLVK